MPNAGDRHVVGRGTEILGDEAGWLVPPGDPDVLVGALEAMRAEPARSLARVEAGGRWALALFTERRMRDGIAAIVRDVAGRAVR